MDRGVFRTKELKTKEWNKTQEVERNVVVK